MVASHLNSKRNIKQISKNSTTTNVLKAIFDFTVHLNSNLAVHVIYIYFKTAFDSVVIPRYYTSFFISLSKHSNVVDHGDSYTKKSQQVSLEQVNPKSTPVISGVSQGYVLGLILFVTIVYDLDILLNGESPFKRCAEDLKR